ncbi:PREDICTED: E3 ubiquitin-protein ligase RNF181-like [Camelina sativa]|uniref:E3 ubiquitin-protein ligase RNF181-like n=1 Tax=Camelina sativa TaxID=90675 RepID=A0ABM0Y8W2_CAMSA|nr:PREDICTED: E3 ubiquitin-protein ligase RNF181-like [Camelina sativa]XP_010501521.1 PREDICTED: E3 ubiquitin-protein ligase RNF181-like [Camelina sativa]
MVGGLSFSHEIDRNPAVSDAGTIKAYATMVTLDETVRTFSITWLADYVMEDEGLSSREDLNDLLMEAGFPVEPSLFTLTEFANDRIIEVTSSGDHTTDCALFLKLTFRDHLSFDDTVTCIRFRPATELAMRSLTKKIYYKTSSIGDKCTICLEELKDGAKVVTLPCGHEFDDKCIVEWFGTSHFCPLCGFELPCEDQ